MTDFSDPNEILERRLGLDGTSRHAAARPAATNGRPIRKDEIELAERGVYVESWLPERRSRRKPLVLVHGELAGSWVWERWLHYFAARGWEAHALNLRNHYWSQTADPTSLSFDTYLEDVLAVLERVGPSAVVVGHGMGGLLVLKAAERASVTAIILVAPELPAQLRPPAQPHELRDVPDAYGRDAIGWATLHEKLVRDHRDLSDEDVSRVAHMLGQRSRESGRARRQVLSGVPVDRQAIPDVPRLVIGAGLDRRIDETGSESLAEWLGAEYEPFGAHSHYGLLIGEQSYLQVVEAVRAFLETHRL